MEQQILEILKGNYYPLGELDDDEMCAKEITAHIFEFIEWINREAETHYNGTWYGVNNMIEGTCSTQELYQYWLTNIKK